MAHAAVAYTHSMSAPIARVQGKAPHWAGTAVVNGDFEEISLDRYAGLFASEVGNVISIISAITRCTHKLQANIWCSYFIPTTCAVPLV